MTLEDFKDVYKDKSLVEKLRLLARQFDILRSDAVQRTNASWRGNDEDVRYYKSECRAMEDRIEWLMAELTGEMERLEPMPPKVEDAWPNPIYTCGQCGSCAVFFGKYKAKYCMECGRRVKWE